MRTLARALRRVRWRIRLQRMLSGACTGLAFGMAAALCILAASFFMPLRRCDLYMLCAASGMPLAALLADCAWPVKMEYAARQADACGLMERVQTALALLKRTDDMALLQREDALAALNKLNVREKMPLRVPKKPLAAAAGLAALCALLTLAPNPQDGVLRDERQFQRQMALTAQLLEKQAQEADTSALSERDGQELRRLLGELSKEVAESRDTREALTKLSQAQNELSRLLSAKESAKNALLEAGMDALSQALESGDMDALAQALSETEAQKLDEAAQITASDTASGALQEAAQSLEAGDNAQAAAALGALNSPSELLAQLSAALQGARSAAVNAGAQGNEGGTASENTGGQSGSGNGLTSGMGGGAGLGSANEGAKTAGAETGGALGQNAPEAKMGAYEAIYDPTRLGGSGEIEMSTGDKAQDGEVHRVDLMPGQGDATGSVPYAQVASEYREAAVQAAREADLPAYVQEWVDAYFSALLD